MRTIIKNTKGNEEASLLKFNFDISVNKFKCDNCGNEIQIPYMNENEVSPVGCSFVYTYEGKEIVINDGEVKVRVPSLSKMSDYTVICKCGNEVFNGKHFAFAYKKKPESEKSTLRKVIETSLDMLSKIP